MNEPTIDYVWHPHEFDSGKTIRHAHLFDWSDGHDHPYLHDTGAGFMNDEENPYLGLYDGYYAMAEKLRASSLLGILDARLPRVSPEGLNRKAQTDALEDVLALLTESLQEGMAI